MIPDAFITRLRNSCSGPGWSHPFATFGWILRRSTCRAALIGAALISSWIPAGAGPPPGFEVVRLTRNSDFEALPDINDCGQIVYARRMGSQWSQAEIFIYDNQTHYQMTSNADRDVIPVINRMGQIVWLRGPGNQGPKEVILYDHGEEQVLAENFADVSGPFINDQRHVSWDEFKNTGCDLADTELMFWDGKQTTSIAGGSWSHQSSSLNEQDWVAWTRYDFCPNPWEAEMMLYNGQEFLQLTDHENQPQLPDVNNLGQVSWASANGDGTTFIALWQDGRTERLIDWGRNANINDRTEVAFYRWHDDVDSPHTWFYRNGEFWLVTDDPAYNYATDINNHGEVVMEFENFPITDIGFMRRIRTGEADFDGDIDLADYAEASRCLDGPDFLDRHRTDPTDTLCECRFLDLDHDNDVDLADFARFQSAFRP